MCFRLLAFLCVKINLSSNIDFFCPFFFYQFSTKKYTNQSYTYVYVPDFLVPSYVVTFFTTIKSPPNFSDFSLLFLDSKNYQSLKKSCLSFDHFFIQKNDLVVSNENFFLKKILLSFEKSAFL